MSDALSSPSCLSLDMSWLIGDDGTATTSAWTWSGNDSLDHASSFPSSDGALSILSTEEQCSVSLGQASSLTSSDGGLSIISAEERCSIPYNLTVDEGTSTVASQKLAKQVSHRKVDRRRRVRERRAFMRLAELVALNKGEQPELPRAASSRLPVDKVTLLEAACKQLEVLRHSQLLMSSLSSSFSSITYTAPNIARSPFDASLPVRLQPSRRLLVGLTTTQSLLWARAEPADDVASEVASYLQTTHLRSLIHPVASQLFSVNVTAASSDPQMTRAVAAAAALLRGEVAEAEIDLGCPAEEKGQWVDMHGVIWPAVISSTGSHHGGSVSRTVSTTCMLMIHNCVFAFEQRWQDFPSPSWL